MDSLIVACIQQRMHLPNSQDEHRETLRRFLRVAANKGARLVVFPELGGLMLTPPMLGDFRSTLLKRADAAEQKHATLWQQMVGRLSGRLGAYLKADLRRSLAALLDVAGPDVWRAYVDVYGGLAREFGVTLIAPSAYLPDPVDGVVRNLAAVFDEQGQLLGTQAKVVLHPADVDLAQPGSTWDVIPTAVGRVGVILGGDVLYPEVGRLLAYQGADLLVTPAACSDLAMYHKVRSGMLARMQDNQLFAVSSFLVGRNAFGGRAKPGYVGKSAIFAPQELTPRFNGVLVEMGGPHSEGVVVAEWDFAALKRLWESSDTPVRRALGTTQMGNALSEIYARLQRLPAVAESRLLEEPELSPGADGPLDGGNGGETTQAEVAALALDDLTVLGSITSRWPRPVAAPADAADAALAGPEELGDGAAEPASLSSEAVDTLASARAAPPDADTTGVADEEGETDEMDSLEG